jgi:predicted enzyme related to lactoylglutathione lyase
MSMVGSLVHFELACSDPQRAQAFFRGLLGWQAQPYDSGSYLYIDGRPSGGLMSGQPGTAIIEELPGIGRSVHCHDDQGMPFSLFQSGAKRET